MEIYKKILSIAESVSTVFRDREIQTSKGTYRVTTYESVLQAVREKLFSAHLILLRTECKSEMVGNICKVDCTFKLIDCDDGETIQIASTGTGHDVSDKNSGKALTYALKYALRDMFLLSGSDSDDPDTSSSENNIKRDMEQRLSPKTLIERVNRGLIAGKISQVDANRTIDSLEAIPPNDKAQLEAASAFLSSIGIPL